MRVCVGSAGRFHTFDLARQLERRGMLRAVYTGYPRWKVDGLPVSKIRALPWVLGARHIMVKLGARALVERFSWLTSETFDRWMAGSLEACDVFHCLSSFGLYAHRTARERYGARTVCDRGSTHIVHQDEILAQEHARWGIHYRPIDRHIVERELLEYAECDLILVPSMFAYRSFVQRGISEAKVARVPYGVDLSLFRPMHKGDDVFRVIYVGTLSFQKGIPYLLEAVSTLRLSKFEVWLIGGCMPEIHPFLKKYEGHYRYFGTIPRAELAQYYSQGSVLVIASVQEGLALVQAQAMACGLPVIATTNTGAEDLFTDGVEGFVVSIRSPEAIREKLIYLYGNPDVHREMGAAALRRVQTLRGWDTYGTQVIDNYRKVLRNH